MENKINLKGDENVPLLQEARLSSPHENS